MQKNFFGKLSKGGLVKVGVKDNKIDLELKPPQKARITKQNLGYCLQINLKYVLLTNYFSVSLISIHGFEPFPLAKIQM